MGYLLPILIALGSLALEDVDARLPSWGTLALLPVPYCAAYIQRHVLLSGRFRLAQALDKLFRILPVALQYVAIGVFGWLGILEHWVGGEVSFMEWPRPALLLALAPFVAYTLASIHADSCYAGGASESAKNIRGFQIRMFLTGLGPVCGYVLFASLVGTSDLLRLGIEEIALWSLGFTLVVGLAFITFLPVLLRRTWDTTPFEPGPERDLLQRVADLADFRCRELLIWRTGNLMANAAIVGLFAAGRRVFFTDALLAQSGPRQLAAVYAHEIGHAKRGHVFIFLICSMAFFAGLDLALEWFAVEQEWIAGLSLAGGLALWLLGFGWLSRRVELDADLFSLELLRDGIGITSALQMVGGGSQSRDSWRHFSPQTRIAFLNRVALEPELGIALRRRLRAIWLAGGVLLLIAGGMRLRGYGEEYSSERATLDLRLGRYAQASARLEGIPGHDASNLRELAELAATESLGDRASREEALQRVTELAQKTLQERHLETAAGWLALGSYLGDGEAAWAATWMLDQVQPGSTREPAPEHLGHWREAVAEALAAVRAGD